MGAKQNKEKLSEQTMNVQSCEKGQSHRITVKIIR